MWRRARPENRGVHVTQRHPTKVIRDAMWSGPRNISPAMMRSWGIFRVLFQGDREEKDPGAEEVIANGETD
jgi:hypothetical protein